MKTPWSKMEKESFLRAGEWAIGQGPDAPDRRLFRVLLRYLGKPSVLEVGCGTGIEAQGMIENGLGDIDYTGYDFTPEFVSYCKLRYPEYGFKTVDATKMSEQEVADVVYSRAMLEHIVDGEKAFRALCEAARQLVVISWFIRPSWCEDEVGVMEVGDFVHHTYSARDLTEIAVEYGGLYRFDFDHHSTKASVWVIVRDDDRTDLLIHVLHDFLSSDEFLDSLLPVPPDPQEELNDLKDVMRGVIGGFDRVLQVAERVTNLLDVLSGVQETLADPELIELVEAETEIPIRTINARTVAALQWRGGEKDALEAQQIAKDAKARAESALQ